MAKKRNYQKYSNIENYCVLDHPCRRVSFLELPDSEVAKKIDEFINICLAHGLKNPYCRFMYGRTDDTFLLYTDQKKGVHVPGWQTFESATKYVTENY